MTTRLLDDIEASIKSTSKSLAAIVEFQQALTVLNASAYAQRTPLKYTKALQASGAEFDKACLALKLHLLRSKAALKRGASNTAPLPATSPVKVAKQPETIVLEDTDDEMKIDDNFLNDSLFGDSVPPSPSAPVLASASVSAAAQDKGKGKASAESNTSDESIKAILGSNNPVDLQSMWSSISNSVSLPADAQTQSTSQPFAVPSTGASSALGLNISVPDETASVPAATTTTKTMTTAPAALPGLGDVDLSNLDFGSSDIDFSAFLADTGALPSTAGGNGAADVSQTEIDELLKSLG